MERPVIVEVT